MARTFLRGLLLFLFTTLIMTNSIAQTYTEQDAIDVALDFPFIGDSLEGREDWYAKAYATQNVFNVWRVNFYSDEGEDWGWADVIIERARVFGYDVYIPSSEERNEEAYAPIREFVDAEPTINELLDGASVDEIYVEYNPWAKGWGVYIEAGERSLYMIVAFEDGTMRSFDNPSISNIYFPDVLAYDEWETGISQQAIAVAFADVRVGEVLQGVEGWTTETERQQNDVWNVAFLDSEGNIVVSATVNVKDKTTLAIE